MFGQAPRNLDYFLSRAYSIGHTRSVSLAPDHKRWAEALVVKREHGDRAFAHVVEQIVASAQEGDFAALDRWREIGERVGQLTEP